MIKGTLIGATTDIKGKFFINKIKSGNYTIVASLVGFKKEEIKNIIIEAGKETYIEILLSPGAVQMGQVIVTAGKHEQTFSDVPASVSVVQAREIYSRNIVSVDDALRYIGGVNLIESQISIRGSSGYSKGVGSRALVLIDGVPLITGDTGEPIYESMPVNFIERIEVLKGASSALYGSGALGGVINIITRDLPDLTSSWFKLYGGFYDKPIYKQWQWTKSTQFLNGFALAHSRKFGVVKTLISLSRTEDDGYRKNSRIQRWNIYSKSLIDFNPSQKLSVTMNYLDQKRNNFLYWKSLDSALVPTDDQLGDMVISKRFATNAIFKNIVSDKFVYLLKGIWYYTNWRNNVEFSNDHSNSHFADLEFQFNYQPTVKHILTSGIEFNTNKVKSNIFGNRSGFNSAIYIQDEYKINENIRTTLGLRLDVAKRQSIKTQIQFNPKFGISYNPLSDLSLRLSAGRAFRAPTISEAFTSTTASGITVIPNPNIRSEKSWGYELGSNYKLSDNILLDAAIFQSNYENLIEPKFVSTFTGQFVNITKARIRGLEIGLNSTWFRNLLNFNFSYTYLDPKDITDNQVLKFRSRHLLYTNILFKFGAFNIMFNSRPQYQVGIDFRYLSKIERIDEQFKLYIKDSEERVPIYILDINFSYEDKFFDIPIKYSFHINNLLNYYYVELVGNLAPIRHFVFRVETTL
ncbi:MAG: hypothetical protein IGBAC_1956 [Ignavibacteriae bacterium]|nr:MAG: hypothetical protein IGBAC_1956 [Ignavibacteriota bacterium]